MKTTFLVSHLSEITGYFPVVQDLLQVIKCSPDSSMSLQVTTLRSSLWLDVILLYQSNVTLTGNMDVCHIFFIHLPEDGQLL